MKNKKILFILIPVLIVVLALIAGVVYLKLNSSPEKIFKNSISKVFSMIKPEKEDYSTVKGTMNFTASVEPENEEMQEIKTMLEGSSIAADMQVDTANMIINENINVIYNNENLLNAAIILQDEKGYVYLKDYLDKYLELPEETLDYSELSDLYKKSATLNQNLLMDAIEEELIRSISNQNLLQEGATLVLDGQETKVTASILNLKGTEYVTFFRGILENLKLNQNFQIALGDYKEDVLEALNSMHADMEADEDVTFNFTIYTKGFLNEFVGISAKAIDNYYQEVTGLEILKHNAGKYQILVYDEYEGEREEAFNITLDNKKESKDKGTATITITVDEEQYTFVYNYEKQENQLSFTLSTEFEGVGLSISGNTVENGNNIKGNMVISVQEETFGKANLNYTYDFTYGVQIQKVDTRNSVLIDELSEEDQTTLMTNVQNSSLYRLVEGSGLFESDLGNVNDKPEVTCYGYTVKYNVPRGFESSGFSLENSKAYTDKNFNLINVSINNDSADIYMSDLDAGLQSDFYENEKISDTKSININGKEYKVRTITYNDEDFLCTNLYFVYELDNPYCYVVEVESVGGNISMDTIKYFLDVHVVEDNREVNSPVLDPNNMTNDIVSTLNGLNIVTVQSEF